MKSLLKYQKEPFVVSKTIETKKKTSSLNKSFQVHRYSFLTPVDTEIFVNITACSRAQMNNPRWGNSVLI